MRRKLPIRNIGVVNSLCVSGDKRFFRNPHRRSGNAYSLTKMQKMKFSCLNFFIKANISIVGLVIICICNQNKAVFSMHKDSQEKISASYLRLLMGNQHQIYSYILKRIPNSSDADDIMQEVAIILWEKFDQFQPGTNFAAWAITIARNKVLNFIRKNRNDRILFSTQTIEMLDDHTSDNKRDKKVKSEIGGILKKCVSKLPENDRGLLQMRYSMDITIKALAGRIGRPVHGLYSSLARIHNTLVDCVRRSQLMEETK